MLKEIAFLVPGLYRWICVISFIGVLIGGAIALNSVKNTLTNPDFQKSLMEQGVVRRCAVKAYQETQRVPSGSEINDCLLSEGIQPDRVVLEGPSSTSAVKLTYTLDGKRNTIVLDMSH